MEATNPTIPRGKLTLTSPDGQECEYALTEGQFTIGRGSFNDIVLHDSRVSRAHAQLTATEIGYKIVDLESANGVAVNGVRVAEAWIGPGDLVTLGDSRIEIDPIQPPSASDLTILNTMAELDATLQAEAIDISVNDTSVPRLAVTTSEETWEIPLTVDHLTIGRSADNRIVLNDVRVSRNHAAIERRGNNFIVRDLNSGNGTYVSGERIEEWTLLPGDTIQIGDARLVFKPGFRSEELTFIEPEAKLFPEGRRPVIFLPGLMGSELWRGSEQVWPSKLLLFTEPELFMLPDRYGLEPRDIVREVVIVPNVIKQEQYSPMGTYLEQELGYERGKDYLEYAYDWRQDVRESARRLAAFVDAWNVRGPITIIAHSLGTLVSRYYVERLGGKAKVDRLVLMGGPHAGAPKSLTSLVLGPHLLPFGLLGDRLRQVLVTFPSVYQILPTYDCVIDQDGRSLNLFEDVGWATEIQRPLLEMARGFREELGTRSSISTLSIFGYGHKTITGIRIIRNSDGGWAKVDIETAEHGDATVPQQSAIVERSEIHPVRQNHGALFLDNDVKMRLKLELAH